MEQVDFDKLELDYYINYYDGPMTGMARYDGRRLWFDLDAEDYEGDRRIRTFKVYQPSEQQLKEHDYWHGEFQKYVRTDRTNLPESEWPKFYGPYGEAKKTFQPFTEDQVVFLAVEK